MSDKERTSDIEGDGQQREEKRRIQLELNEAAFKGNWETARRIYEQHPQSTLEQILTKEGETALHIATAAEHAYFVQKLLVLMPGESSEFRNSAGDTALNLAAMSGAVPIAKLLVSMNPHLTKISNETGELPICTAASLGHKEMVRYLYSVTELEDNNVRIRLLVALINVGMYDIAFDMIRRNPDLISARRGYANRMLYAFARKSQLSMNNAHKNPSGIWSKYISPCTNIWRKENIRDQEAVMLFEFLWKRVLMFGDKVISKLIRRPMFVAAEKGNVEFLRILIRSYPQVVFITDGYRRSIFHIAIMHRQEDIFKMIHEIGSIKNLLAAYADKDWNNMLHLAGKLPAVASSFSADKQDGQRTVAAVQMQHELMWFEEVKKVVAPGFIEAKNRDGYTPGELFAREHRGFMKELEGWMRESANQCMVVATLITTVVFAAAFTIPGGNGQDTGIPIFLHEMVFKLFALSDAISFICSTAAVLTFLSISSSSYDEYDFLWSLPHKLLIGFGTLFISIIAMMIAFTAAFFIIFKDGLIEFAVPIAVIASFPVGLFIWQQKRLFVNVFLAIIMSRSLSKPSKRLHSKSE